MTQVEIGDQNEVARETAQSITDYGFRDMALDFYIETQAKRGYFDELKKRPSPL